MYLYQQNNHSLNSKWHKETADAEKQSTDKKLQEPITLICLLDGVHITGALIIISYLRHCSGNIQHTALPLLGCCYNTYTKYSVDKENYF